MNRLAVLLATAGGAGYAPVAPGTAGSAVGLLCVLATRQGTPVLQAVVLLIVVALGVWASQRATVHFASKDPGPVVIDEVAGQLVTLFLVGGGLGAMLVGFFVFRVLDIVKPWPANALEALPGGWGIMADDLMAGLYGWAIMKGIMSAFPGWL
jgi:phosphatidylglycerophosphatase A